MENLSSAKSNNKTKPLAITSKSITAVLLSDGQYSMIASKVKFSIASVLDATPIAELKRQLPGKEDAIEKFLATQIQLLIESVNVTQNIEPHQVPGIAKTLIELFPVESLEDFVLCFKRGALAMYGPLYNRLDASVLCEWMQKFLDEKYQVIEANVLSNQVQTNSDNLVNYEAYRERVEKEGRPKASNNLKSNEYERQRLENPYKYFQVRNLQVMARSQEHAEAIVEGMISTGELIEESES
jgi:hypothetical protein